LSKKDTRITPEILELMNERRKVKNNITAYKKSSSTIRRNTSKSSPKRSKKICSKTKRWSEANMAKTDGQRLRKY